MAKLEIKIHISSGIIDAISGCMKFGCNYIEDCRFATAIIAMKNGYVVKIKNSKIYFWKNTEGIIAFKKLFAVSSFLEAGKDGLQSFLLHFF